MLRIFRNFFSRSDHKTKEIARPQILNPWDIEALRKETRGFHLHSPITLNPELVEKITKRLRHNVWQVWVDENGDFHREDGPALITHDGTIRWYYRGVPHRDNGPALIDCLGREKWLVHGILHREGGPAKTTYGKSARWFSHGLLHRSDGPAIVCENGELRWYHKGHLHRIDGPAIERPTGIKEWWLHGARHRENHPAIVGQDSEAWYFKGKKHRLGAPAVIRAVTKTDNDAPLRTAYETEWWFEGLLHRNDGPAVEKKDGMQMWFQKGFLHRKDGPAIIMPQGSRLWYKNGFLHRDDGPAVEVPEGYDLWMREPSRFSRQNACAQIFINECKEVASGAPSPFKNVRKWDSREWWYRGKRTTEEETNIRCKKKHRGRDRYGP